MGMVAGERSFQDGEGTRAEAGVGENLAEVGYSTEMVFFFFFFFENCG